MVDYEYVEDESLIDSQIKHCARRLREEREKLRISQMDLSFKAGLSQNQVNYIETGKRSPTLYTLLKLCNALHISPSILFDMDEEEERRQDFRMAINLIAKYL